VYGDGPDLIVLIYFATAGSNACHQSNAPCDTSKYCIPIGFCRGYKYRTLTRQINWAIPSEQTYKKQNEQKHHRYKRTRI